MSLIIDTVQAFLPSKRKHTPSGWTSFDAVCCNDKRQRGGLIVMGDSVSYHCFNCQFKASWQPGRLLTSKFKKLLYLFNVPDEQIGKCSLEALRLKENVESKEITSLITTLHNRELPRGALLLKDNLDDPLSHPIIEYIYDRGFDIDSYPWHYSTEIGFTNRLIIPFYYQNRIVGYTARLIKDGKPKYISEQQPGYVFNLDNQIWQRQFAVLCEGPLDAIAIDGMAVLGSELSPRQKLFLDRLRKEIIVVPDKDHDGHKIVKQAIEYGWTVSMPDWPEGVKDVADAVKRLGKLTTLFLIIQSKLNTGLKIELRAKGWFK